LRSKLWKPGAGGRSKQWLAVSGKDNCRAGFSWRRAQPPRRPPLGLHPWDYANMLALDARLSRERGILKKVPASGAAGDDDRRRPNKSLLARRRWRADGSFFVKVPGRPADSLLRLLMKKGAVLRREHGWFWIRQGEQRIFVSAATRDRSVHRRIALPDVIAAHDGRRLI